ncbi:MAG: aminoacyl-tRNA hydrolase [Holosporales bacterium]|nr:aminoacyl-tRNA hydrolase [Holosporales bacterium]
MATLLVGLGNPGDNFKNTRHNAGFCFVDRLADSLGITSWKSQFEGVVSACQDGKLGALILLKPQTMMNLSGRSVISVLNYFKLTVHNLIVAHDDLDVSIGQIKIKRQGSHGGHNGLRSIHQLVSSDEYRRLRIGIGRPADKDMVRAYVLSEFSRSEQTLLTNAIDAAIMTLPQTVFD